MAIALARYYLLVAIHPVYLEYLLCQIDTNSFNVHLDSSSAN